ncbi:MAG: 6-hydroxymethylpterin diphosphokinase MptE-like protein [Kordiimonas sp.]
MKTAVKIWEFHPATSCLFFIIETTCPENQDVIYAECKPINDRPLDFNSWLNVKTLHTDTLEIRGSIILPQDTDLRDFSIQAFNASNARKYEVPIAKIAVGQSSLTSGILAYLPSKSSSSAHMTFWSQQNDISLTAFEGTIETMGEKQRLSSGLYYHQNELPPNTGSITCSTDSGAGQSVKKTRILSENTDMSDPNILKFKDVHKGQAAWLIGNGPSVEVQDLELLKDEVTFGFNRFYLAHDKTSFRPTYTVSADRQVIEDFGAEILDNLSGPTFFANHTPTTFSQNHIWVRQESFYPSLFSKDASRFVTTGGSSMYVAMQLAYYMGIRHIYIYGMDFSFNIKRNFDALDQYKIASGDDNHFIENYRSGKHWCPPDYRFIANSLWGASCVMEAEGGFIKNTTHGGRLDCLDRIPFSSAINIQTTNKQCQ